MRFRNYCLAALACGVTYVSHAAGLDAKRLGVIFNVDDPRSREIALYYAQQRSIQKDHLIGIHLPDADSVSPKDFAPLRAHVLDQLPSEIQSLVLVWSRPYAVGCMSITSAFAAGYRAEFCEPGCGLTEKNPLFDSDGWLPADTVGWWPAMLLPSNDLALARDLIDRGVKASRGSGSIVYLVSTRDSARNVRAATYAAVSASLSRRQSVLLLSTPVRGEVSDAIGYFTGTARVEEIARIHFTPGAIADHLTSTAGVLFGSDQMAALAWLKQGATASYGTVSEPCNHLEKFPDIAVLWRHYLSGETALEAYWKSVRMPGQGLFIGEPLARPFAKSGL